MISRHRAREIALQILYRYDVAIRPETAAPPALEDVRQDLERHFRHFQVPDPLQEFVGQLVSGTLSKLGELDQYLEKHASNWKVARMGFVDRSLLRMAVYELLFLTETPPSVVIDEAVELAKQFGTAETPSFVNGILDAIKANVRAEPQ